MELLHDMAGKGYQRDYLLARIKGRRRYLVENWRALLAAPDPLAAVAATPYRPGPAPGTEEVIWSGLLREFAWLYSQMEQNTRTVFAPFFLYFELRTVILCLRQRLAGDERRIAELLRFTLLSPQVQRVLREENDLSLAVGELSGLFARLAEPFKGLRRAFHEGGLAGFEERLTTLYLEHVADGRHQPVIGGFFHRLIDVRNAVALAKHQRWRTSLLPSFIRGGRIGEAPFQEAAKTGGVGTILRRLAGTEAELTATNLESLLLGRLTRQVRRMGRESTETGCILDYLWRIAVEARNLSLLVHGVQLERNVISGELVR